MSGLLAQHEPGCTAPNKSICIGYVAEHLMFSMQSVSKPISRHDFPRPHTSPNLTGWADDHDPDMTLLTTEFDSTALRIDLV